MARRRKRMAQRLPSPFSSSLTSGFALTVPFMLGGLLFGASYILDEAEEYVAELLAIVATLALVWPVVFLFHLLSAPAEIWRRDQEIIASLRAPLLPALRLEFTQDECMRCIRRGRYDESLGGKKWHQVTRLDLHILIKCTNVSQVRVNRVEAHVVGLVSPPGGTPGSGFFQSVRLRPPGADADEINLLPGGRCFFSIIAHGSEYDSPTFYGEGQPFDYEFLFARSGTYEIRIDAHGEGTKIETAILELEVERREKGGGTTDLRYEEFEILSVRQKDRSMLE